MTFNIFEYWSYQVQQTWVKRANIQMSHFCISFDAIWISAQNNFLSHGYMLFFALSERPWGAWCSLSSPLRQKRVIDSSAPLFCLTRAFVLWAWPCLTTSFLRLFAPDFNSGVLYLHALSELYSYVIQVQFSTPSMMFNWFDMF